MAIRLPPGPKRGTDLVADYVQALMLKGPNAMAPTGGADDATKGLIDSEAPSASKPIRLFALNLDDILDESFLFSAKPVGWRYLILGPKDAAAIAVADVSQRVSDGRLSFSRLTRGPLAARLQDVTHLAEKYSTPNEAEEPRVLEVPALNVSAFWLHSTGSDLLFPLSEGVPDFAPSEGPDADFVGRVLQMALAKRHLQAGEMRGAS